MQHLCSLNCLQLEQLNSKPIASLRIADICVHARFPIWTYNQRPHTNQHERAHHPPVLADVVHFRHPYVRRELH